ncbi:hypothetical protein [Kitasatospora sp. NPDC088134]|uniref:hypothetical protein n=1 Tax=Kitasatospora sp. NPDC088134 TaxID=3364071 RepID=UPI00380331B5
MTALARLWSREQLPIRDGLYTAAGGAFDVEVDPRAPGGLRVLDGFDVEEFLREDPEWITSLTTTAEVELPAGAGYLCCGEGSHGSEGFFARLSPDHDLLWAVYLEESNPFVDLTVTGDRAVIRSTADVTIVLDLRSESFRPVT